MVLKWGIVSAGKISTGFAKALSILPENHKMVAIAARDLHRAQEFASIFSIEKAYDNYELIAKDPEIEVVYIGCLHPQHFEVSKLMLENGKHVLCEKPLTMNEKQTRELINISNKCDRFLMEAIWSRCFPIYDELKKSLKAGIIGDVQYVSVQFGMKLNTIARLNEKDLGGGTILDLGVYNLQFQQFIFEGIEPVQFVAAGHLNEFKTDEQANAILIYEEGKTAVLSTSASAELTNEAIIVGKNGTIKVPFFWRPTTMISPNGVTSINLPDSKYEEIRPGGMSYEAEEVRKCIEQGLLESPKVPHADSIQLAKWMDNWRKQIGVFYREDNE